MSVPKLPGPENRPTPAGLAEALRLLHNCEPRTPTEADAPQLSLLPMTPAARAALRMYRNGGSVRQP